MYLKTSPKGFSASKCDIGNWIFSKLGIFEKFLGNSLVFLGIFFLDFSWILFGGIFLEDFFWRIFLEDFFWRIFFGGIFFFYSYSLFCGAHLFKYFWFQIFKRQHFLWIIRYYIQLQGICCLQTAPFTGVPPPLLLPPPPPCNACGVCMTQCILLPWLAVNPLQSHVYNSFCDMTIQYVLNGDY